MDKKSKILIVIFLMLVAAAAFWKYQSFVVLQDFVVYDYVSCNPEVESCFVYCEDGECEDEPYKKIEKNAHTIPFCKTYESDNCEELTCEIDEEGCVITTCSEEVLEEGEECYLQEERVENEVEEAELNSKEEE